MRTIITTTLLVAVIFLFSATAVITDTEIMEHLVLKHNENALEPTRQLFDFLEGKAELPAEFNSEEGSHMEDVSNVIFSIKIIFLTLLFMIIILAPHSKFDRALRNAGISALGILVLAILIPFQKLFTWMHYVLFPQGNWTFAANSTIIQYYPAGLFLDYGIILFFVTFLISIVSIVTSIVIKR